MGLYKDKELEQEIILDAVLNNILYTPKESEDDIYELFDLYYCEKMGINEALINKFGAKKYIEIGGLGELINTNDIQTLNPVCIHKFTEPDAEFALNGEKVEYEEEVVEVEKVVEYHWFTKLIRKVIGYFKHE